MKKPLQILVCLSLLLLTACSQQRFSFRKTIPVEYTSNRNCDDDKPLTKSPVIKQITPVSVSEEKNIIQTQAVAPGSSVESKIPTTRWVKSFKITQPNIATTQKNALVTEPNPQKSGAEIESYALLSIIAAVAGLFVFGLLLGIIAMVFGIIALVQIQKNKKKGTLIAWLGILFGFFDIVALIAYISTL